MPISLTPRRGPSIIPALLLAGACSGNEVQFQEPTPRPDLLVCPGGDGSQRGKAVAFAADGAVYFAGTFASEFVLVEGDARPSTGGTDVFVLRIGPEKTTTWIRTFGGPGNDEINALVAAPGGGVYLAGSFRESVDFDPGPLDARRSASGPGPEGFVLHLSAAGAFLRVHTIAGAGMAAESQVDTLVANSNGDVWLAGRFRGAMTLPEPEGAANARNMGGYVVRLDPEWRATWGLVIDSEGDDTAYVAGAAEGPLWVTGSFAKAVSLRLARVSALTSTAATSAYSIRLFPDPPVATTLGGPDAEVTVRGAAPTGTGGLLVAGHSSGDLYPGHIPPARKQGAFLASYSIDGDLMWLTHAENGDPFSYGAVGAAVEHGAVVAGVGAISDSAAGGPGQVSLARYSAAGLAGWSRKELPVGEAFDLDTRPGELAMAGYYIRESRLTLQSSTLSCGRSPLTPENARSEKAFMVSYRRDSVP